MKKQTQNNYFKCYASIAFLISSLGLFPQIFSQSLIEADGTVVVVDGIDPIEIRFNSSGNPCNDYMITLEGLNEVNGVKFDEWFGETGSEVDGIISLTCDQVPGDLICHGILPVVSMFPPLSGNNCSSDQSDCDGPSAEYSSSCMVCNANVTTSEPEEAVGGYAVCVKLQGPGANPNGSETLSEIKRVFYFCFKGLSEPEPELESLDIFGSLSHICDDPFVDDASFNASNPEETTMANSLYFRINNTDDDLEFDACGETIPQAISVEKLGHDASNRQSYWRIVLDESDPSLSPGVENELEFSFCLRNTTTGELVPDLSIDIEFCYKGGERPLKPNDVIFVMDKSGSMTNDLNSTYSKFQAANIVFSSILTRWKEIESQDQVGLVFFNSSQESYDIERVDANSLYSPSTASCLGLQKWPIISRICAVDVTGATSLGAGMQKAIQMLNPGSDDRRKHIILLTDGMQNRPPYVTRERFVDFNVPAFLDGIPVVPEEVYAYNADEDLKVQKIGGGSYSFKGGDEDVHVHVGAFGQSPGNNYYRFLTKLALDTRGTSDFFGETDVEGSGAGERFALELLGIFSETQSDASPRTVYKNVLSGSGNVDVREFSVAGDYTLMQIVAGNIRNNNITFDKIEVRNGGSWQDLFTSIPATAVQPDLTSNSPFRVFTIDFEALSIPVGSRVRVTTRSAASNFNYFIKAFVDDRGVKFRSDILRKQIDAGESLPLKVHIFQKNDASPGGIRDIGPNLGGRVTAIIRRPQLSYSRVFSEENLPKEFVECNCIGSDVFEGGRLSQNRKFINTRPKLTCQYGLSAEALTANGEDRNSPFEEKKQFLLLGDTKYQVLFSKIEEEIELSYQGGGVYTANYDETQFSGDYEVEFTIEGPNNFNRKAKESAIVGFGKPDRKKSQLRLQGENTLLLTYKPRDQYLNMLGANKKNAISLGLVGGKADEPVDYLNGRYESQLRGKAVKYGSNLRLEVDNKLLYQGKLWKLLHPLKIAVQGGLTFPVGDFGNSFKRYYTAEGKLGLRLSGGLFIQAKGGYYSFLQRLDISKTEMSLAGGGLQYNFPIIVGSGWNMYLEANAGQYFRSGRSNRFGINPALGFSKTLIKNMAFIAEGGYHYLTDPTNPIDFFTTTAGVRWSMSRLGSRNKVPCTKIRRTFALLPDALRFTPSYAFPQGSFASNLNRGVGGNLSFIYFTIDRAFDLKLEGTYFQFTNKVTNNNLNVYGGGGGFSARKNFDRSNRIPFPLVFGLEGTVGYYFNGTDWGLGYRGALSYDFSELLSPSSAFTFMLQGSIQQILRENSDPTFWTFGVSVGRVL